MDMISRSRESAGAGHADTPRRGMSAYTWYVVLALTMLNLVGSLDRFVMAVQIVPLKRDMGLTDTQLGLLYGFGFSLLYALGGIYAGRCADRFNRQRIILFGCLVWTVASMAGAFTSTFLSLLATRAVVGLAESTLVPAAVSLLGAYVLRSRLGIANGLFFSGVTLGKALAFIGGGVALGVLASRGGLTLFGHHFVPWQGVFLLSGIPGVVAALMMISVREPRRARPESAVSSATYADLFRHIGRHRGAYLLFLVSGTCMNLLGHILAAWTPSFFVREYGLDVSHAAVIVGVISIGAGIVGGVTGGMVTDTITRRGSGSGPAVALVVALLIMAPTGVLAFSGLAGLGVAVVAYALVHATVIMGTPQAWTGVQALTPIRYRGMMSAVFLGITSIVSVGFGPLAIGLWSDHVYAGSSNSIGYSVITGMAMFIGIGIAAGLASRRPLAEVSAIVEREQLAAETV
ncbi:MFS transporter [Sphingomonas sp. YL-JM2C]